jgi:hypothetical protein
MGAGKYPEKDIKVQDMPSDLDPVLYSALMRLLATNGAGLRLGMNWYWDYRTVYLRLRHTDLAFLEWLGHYFSDVFDFTGKFLIPYKTSKSFTLSSLPSVECFIIWQHWFEQGINVLPLHFRDYFSIHTLAFWSMRNGQWKWNQFYIHVGTLNHAEKELLQQLIKEKLGYESKLAMNNTKLAIQNPEKLVAELRPLFHESQLHRLVRVTK